MKLLSLATRTVRAARLVLSLASFTALTLAYQNCSRGGFQTASLESLETGTSYCSVHPGDSACALAAPACSFNGQTIAEGQSLSAYLNASSASGSCQSETRVCHNGVLSGSYNFATCTAGTLACSFNGQTVPDGGQVTAFLAGGGSSCQAETRVCHAGVLSGSYAYASCSANAAASCLFNGQTIAHGTSVTAFTTNTVAAGQTCVPQTRTCFNGTLSGQGQYASCTVAATGLACLFNNQTIADGQHVSGYASSTVPSGQTCSPVDRVCHNGVLSGSGDFASCSVQQAASCMINGQTIPSGGSVTLYTQAQAGNDGLCPTQTRSCTNGQLSGTATFASCTVSDKAVCGADVVNRADLDAADSLEACFAKNVSLFELVPGRYYVGREVQFSGKANATLRTQNVTSGPACLSPGASACAIITGKASYNGSLWRSFDLTNVTFDHVAIDGNIAARRKAHPQMDWGPQGAYNMRIHCVGCTLRGFASVRSPHGTGLEYLGDNATFDTVLFRDNGWGGPLDPTRVAGGNSPWSDGLTIWNSSNLQIRNSMFVDNSDVDLIIGGAQNAVIENNQIGNSFNNAFAGLMLDNFNDVTPGNFSGAIVRNNTIDCGNGMCGIGLMIGPHFWYNSHPITGGTVTGNGIVGARQGLLTAGATGFTVSQNTVNVFGLYTNPAGSCLTNPISVTNGDQISFQGNTPTVTANGITACGPEDVFYLLSNFNGTDLAISQIYRDVFARDPDVSGGPTWTNAYRGGSMSLADIRASFANSDEAKSHLNDLYQKVLGRDIDASGLATARSFLANGGQFVQLYVRLRLSDEALARPLGLME